MVYSDTSKRSKAKTILRLRNLEQSSTVLRYATLLSKEHGQSTWKLDSDKVRKRFSKRGSFCQAPGCWVQRPVSPNKIRNSSPPAGPSISIC